MDKWMSGVKRIPFGPLTQMYGDGPNRAIWHFTGDELDDGKGPSFNALVSYFSDNPGMAPHLLWSPFTGEIVQFYPATNGGKSVGTQKYAGQPETLEVVEGTTYYSPNRTGSVCFQIEVLFTPGRIEKGVKYKNLEDTPMVNLGLILTYLRSLDIPDGWPAGVPLASDTATNRRVKRSFWINHGGHYGHSQVPYNSHRDPLGIGDIFARGGVPVPVPKPPFKFNYKKVKFGAKNAHVKKVQKALKAHGVSPGLIDGDFGAATLAAIKVFQRRQKITIDGVVGPVTAARLGLT